jgi:hypothetical protein
MRIFVKAIIVAAAVPADKAIAAPTARPQEELTIISIR